MKASRLRGRRLLLGVTGSIAAYKAASLTRACVQAGAEVTVVMTPAAQHFVTPLTFRTLTGRQVYTDLFVSPDEPLIHLRLAEDHELLLVAPATAALLARWAHGLADDLLSTTFLSCRCPVVVAPAMDLWMWTHPATRHNLDVLQGWGVRVVPPDAGPLASGLVGEGRLADEERILSVVTDTLEVGRPLSGEVVLVTAGPTVEPLDAARLMTNPSTGKMGYAVAAEARLRGAQVVLVTGPTSLAPPAGVEVVRVGTAEEMRHAVLTAASAATVVVMAAAVTDYRPVSRAPGKIKKGTGRIQLELEPTPDILAELGRERGRRILVGFAAETDELERHARTKLLAKHLDLIVATDLTAPDSGFGSDRIQSVLLDRETTRRLPMLEKCELARVLLDRVVALIKART